MKKIAAIALIIIITALIFGCTKQQDTTKTEVSGLMTMDSSKNDLIISENKTESETTDANKTTDQNKQIYNNLNELKKVKTGDKISVDYTGKLTDGTVFDSSIGKTPLSFTVGAGQMIKGFDEGVIGMKKGETKTITLAPEDAYGPYEPLDQRFFEATELPDFNKLKTGDKLTTTNGLIAEIAQKNDSNALVKFYHQLAGKTLIFEITIISIN